MGKLTREVNNRYCFKCFDWYQKIKRTIDYGELTEKKQAFERKQAKQKREQFEFQMPDINNKIDNERQRRVFTKEKAEFGSIFLLFQFIQKPLFTRFLLLLPSWRPPSGTMRYTQSGLKKHFLIQFRSLFLLLFHFRTWVARWRLLKWVIFVKCL